MKLTLLGTGTAVPRLERSSSAYLLKINDWNILIDCGAGTLRRLLETNTSYDDIDLLLLTHLHPDHTADLVPFLFACGYATVPRTKPLHIVGGKGTRHFLAQLDNTFGRHLTSKHYDQDIREVGDESWTWEGIGFESRAVFHISNSRAFAVEMDGKKVSFSGDSGYCQSLIELAQDSDLFVCECALPDHEKPDNHLSPSQVGDIAAKANVLKLVLTHFYPEVESEPIAEIVGRKFSGEVILGEDLMRIEI